MVHLRRRAGAGAGMVADGGRSDGGCGRPLVNAQDVPSSRHRANLAREDAIIAQSPSAG